jgi:hypothetical protein
MVGQSRDMRWDECWDEKCTESVTLQPVPPPQRLVIYEREYCVVPLVPSFVQFIFNRLIKFAVGDAAPELLFACSSFWFAITILRT